MSDIFDIDDLFEESLGSLKQKPNEMLWDSIEQEIDSTTPAEIHFDNLVASSMAGFTATPSAETWNNINSDLDNFDILNKEFDKKVESSINNMHPQASANVWHNIEKELDAIEAIKIAERKRFVSWFGAASAVIAIFLYFSLQFQPSFNINKKHNVFFQKSSINNGELKTITNNKSNEVLTPSNSPVIASNSKIISSNTKTTKEDISIENKNSHNSIDETNIIANNSTIANLSNNNKENNSITTQKGEVEEQEISLSNISKPYTENVVDFDNTINESMTSRNNMNNNHLLSNNERTIAMNLPLSPSVSSIRAATGFSLDLFAGPEYIYSPNSITYTEGDDILVHKTSSYITDYSIGANLKYHYNRLFIQSGLTYSNFGDIYKYNKSNELHDTTGGFASYIINTNYTYDTLSWEDDPLNPGTLVPVLQSHVETDTVFTAWNSMDSVYYSNESAKSENRYRYIEIPIMLGYQYGIKNWNFNIAAGASYGFKIAEKNTYYDNKNITNKTYSPYSDSSINGIISLGVAYAIGDKISLVLQPTYKTNLIDITAHSTKYHSFTMRFGINIKL
jgi:hypothetical protein